MHKFSKLLLFIVISFFCFFVTTIGSVYADLGDAQNGTVGGADGGYTNGSGNSMGGGSYDPTSDSNSQDSFAGGYSDSSGDAADNFSQMISEAFGLGNDAGTLGGPGGLNGPLSNMNATLDQQGVTASYDLDNDPCLQTGFCPYPEPVLNATASCSGNRPVVNLSWSGIPQPTSANSWLGSYTFLIRSPQLQTALPANGVMRVFPFAAMGYGTNSYADTYREYWNEGYSTAGWTEVTSTDENGTPTGYVEHPGTYTPPVKVLTQTVEPYSFYYYRVYSTNASGSQVYRSDIQGMTYDFSYTARTPVSNIMAVYTPGCGATPPPVATPAPTQTPAPTPTPVATPTPTASLSLVSNNCTSGGTSLATFNFSSTAAGVQSYHLDKNGVYVGSASTANPTLSFSLARGESANFTARVQVASGTYGGSNTVNVNADNCVPTVRPIVNVSLTTPNGTFPAGGLPVTVKQNQPVTINWSIEYASSAQASASPNKSDWSGGKNTVSGSQAISTASAVNYVLTLTGNNVVGATAVSIQLNIDQYPKPYIQTTGGDVHSNETIYMSKP